MKLFLSLVVALAPLLGLCQSDASIEKMTVGCEVVEKPFMKKNGHVTDHQELYLRCSVQDYFIKLCESNVTAEELRKHLDDGVTAEIEIVEGEWDLCDEEIEIQSRMGRYARIVKLVE